MMRHLKLMILSLVTVLGSLSAHALEIEITEGVEGALPIAIVPFAYRGAGNPPAQDVAAVVTADLARSGRFKPLPLADMLARPSTPDAVDFRDWRAVNVENLVIGEIEPNGPRGYLVKFRLFDVFRGGQITGFSFPTTQNDLRSTAHRIADLIYEELIGERGAFDTRIAYITSVRDRQGRERVHLKVADADGYNPQTIVASDEPLMSPAWSPDGRRIAYVSFEKHRPSIWVQDVFTGKRERITSYKGINGAPAWSPDGRRLALTLSKDGNPDIYIFDLRRRSLRKLTRHWAIDTEPAWSPDGKSIVFTSDRGGTPQIYRVPVSGGEPERITFGGNYNARASWAPDGRYLTLVTRVNGNFRIGLLDMENGNLQVLSRGDLDESPSFAPNGSMIIYAGRDDGRGVLWAVSTDGRVRQRLATQVGDVREPAWSPYHQQ
ncbi:Tol-Pal system beta propeller repeat protein TolB [endosymbiont of unidentified scaly snail isolate Monju]|uniref:Tol-Pal system beta propeller repeat protein TolB n=1 Tax=endosymbiont of unidentified scaly snail isolate Monju TaxID=1248727 RepID=UPI0005BC43B9|nr:Tol-Pal system beta propeller repeat protein TolB [endosymbiont of unidentified scaly snail isolate Monju]